MTPRVVALVAVGWFATASHGAESSDALLDECVAGINANFALIEYGTARYRLKKWYRQHLVNPRERTLDLAFDYPLRRGDERSRQLIEGQLLDSVVCRISGRRRHIYYSPPLDGSRLPNANIVLLQADRHGWFPPIDPRQQRRGFWGDPPSFAWEIDYLRRMAKERLSARRDEHGRI